MINPVSVPCSTSYRLVKPCCPYATLAVIRGGFDGYSIGIKIQEILTKIPSISLSQIIRNYYSPNGFYL